MDAWLIEMWYTDPVKHYSVEKEKKSPQLNSINESREHCVK